MTIPHDLQCEIYQIIEHAEPERFSELLAFLVSTAAQLTRPEREALIRLDTSREENAYTRKLLQKYQISKPILLQWQQEAKRDALEEQRLQGSQSSTSSVESGSVYRPSQSSSSQSSDTAQARQPRSQTGTAKWQHTITPIEGEQIRRVIRLKQTNRTDQQCNQEMRDVEHDLRTPGPGTSVDDWPRLWGLMAAGWPTMAPVPFPHTQSRVDEWVAAAHHQPEALLQLLQQFGYSDNLLETLPAEVFEAWTAGWRKECIYGKLVMLRSRTVDRSTQIWLDDWIDKLRRPPPIKLSPLIDNDDDWSRLRTSEYGGEAILRLCDIRNKGKLATHLVCASLYETELQALLGLEAAAEARPLPQLERHLTALKSVPQYNTAYLIDRKAANWQAVARFFSSMLARGDEEWENRQ